LLLGVLLVASFLAARGWLSDSGLLNKAADRPNMPPETVFWLTFGVAVLSLLVSTQEPTFVLPDWVSYLVLLGGGVALGVFSLMCVGALRKRI
jgi:hypothetical protein